MRDYAVEVEHLTVRFGDFAAIDDISFSVNPGEIFGFLGANGAGKTTAIRTLCGLLKPTSGKIWVAGCDPKDGLNLIKGKVGYMSQRFTLYDDLSVAENIAFAGSLRKIDEGLLDARVAELFKDIDFDLPPKTLVKNISGGIKQRLALAVSMLHDPEVLFLDEPTAGVSPTARVKFWDLIRKIAARGKTVFVTTHYMDEAEQCGRVSLMRSGKIIALDSPTNLKSQVYPGPLFEAENSSSSDPNWIKKLSEISKIKNLKPHGLHWHFELPHGTDPKSISLTLGSEIKTIRPSLEDVFIRLVEGLS